MIKTWTIGALIAISLLSACAKRPDAIAPAPVPADMYSGLSCAQASAEYQKVTAEVEAFSRKQSGAATGDAIGVFLVLVPVSTLTGSNVEGELATSKGKKLALEGRLAACRR